MASKSMFKILDFFFIFQKRKKNQNVKDENEFISDKKRYFTW